MSRECERDSRTPVILTMATKPLPSLVLLGALAALGLGATAASNKVAAKTFPRDSIIRAQILLDRAWLQVLQDYTITGKDVAGPFVKSPPIPWTARS